MASKNHPHRYQRRAIGNNKVFACTLPDCTHYQPKHLESMLEGRRSQCNECGEDFILDSDSLKEDSPRCADCRFVNRGSNEKIIPVSGIVLNYLEQKAKE